MGEQTVDVLVAAYPGLAAARAGFTTLCCLVRDGQVTTEYGVILATKELDGTVTLAGAGDHAGRQGLRWSGGVGAVVGLFSPPMLASLVLGRAAAGRPGAPVRRGPNGGIGQNLGGRLAPGTAAVIAVIDGGRPAARRALAGALSTSVVPLSSGGLRELKESLAEVTGTVTTPEPARFRPAPGYPA